MTDYHPQGLWGTAVHWGVKSCHSTAKKLRSYWCVTILTSQSRFHSSGSQTYSVITQCTEPVESKAESQNEYKTPHFKHCNEIRLSFSDSPLPCVYVFLDDSVQAAAWIAISSQSCFTCLGYHSLIDQPLKCIFCLSECRESYVCCFLFFFNYIKVKQN